jgi:hypothetical protein
LTSDSSFALFHVSVTQHFIVPGKRKKTGDLQVDEKTGHAGVVAIAVSMLREFVDK